MENRSMLPTTSTSQRVQSNPLPFAVVKAASAMALLSFLIMIALALFLEAAFESSVCVTDVMIASTMAQWVRIPVDRPGEGHFMLPLALFQTSFLDHLVMPVLFAFMIILASALFVQNLELDRFFF